MILHLAQYSISIWLIYLSHLRSKKVIPPSQAYNQPLMHFLILLEHIFQGVQIFIADYSDTFK